MPKNLDGRKYNPYPFEEKAEESEAPEESEEEKPNEK